ncbi:MAG TPA: hypothetical protein PLL94_02590 [Bacteroidales bacterium]|nr:hypothetical protein [Bacteroidales bacterium]HQK67011.1 hypothetical protein [Bacteroidales bacterium]
MRITFFGAILFALICNTSSAQNDSIYKFYLTSGIGYFGDIIQFLDPGFNEPDYAKVNPAVRGKIHDGMNVWFRLGYNLKTGYIISGYCSMAAISYKINDPLALFWDEYLTDTYKIANVMFSKEIGKKKNRFSLGTGLVYRSYNHQDVDYPITPVYNQDNELIEVLMGLPEPYNLKMNDLGLVLNLEYSYRFNNRFMLGLSCSTNLIFDIGFETISVSPFIGCIF